MKQVIILFLLFLKKSTSNENHYINQNTTDDSFQVNVSAGYGVHSENLTYPSPIYKFQERKNQKPNETIPSNHQDQISQPSQTLYETQPKYKVYEMQPKHYQIKQEQKRSKPNSLEKLETGTKIIEVLRLPAMYELHLQADPQRLASINTAWLSKLMNHETRKPLYSNPIQQSNFLQGSPPNPQPSYQKIKPKYFATKPTYPSQVSYNFNSEKIIGQASTLQGYKYPKFNYQNNFPTQLNSVEIPKETTTINPLSLSNEISSEFYQKPQALHEVPAPVLDKNSYKFGSNLKPLVVPNLVYGKPLDFSTTPTPIWIQETQEPQVYFKQQESNQIQQYQNQNILNSDYQGYKNVQNYYNDEIGGHLDQNLVNVNGGVATFVNPDGTMTISNFHHNPKLYNKPNDYIPVIENQENGETQENFNLNNYNQNKFPKISKRIYKRKRLLEPINYIIYIKQKTIG